MVSPSLVKNSCDTRHVRLDTMFVTCGTIGRLLRVFTLSSGYTLAYHGLCGRSFHMFAISLKMLSLVLARI